MSTRSTTTKNSTTNGRGRGHGRGNKVYHFSNSPQPNVPNQFMGETHPHNERRNPSTFAHNRGSYQSARRGLGSFRGNGNSNAQSNRSGNSRRLPSTDSNSDRIPRHAQNPFFVRELMSRFSSMLPSPSFVEDEAASSVLRNRSNRDPSRNIGFYNQNENNNINETNENKRLEDEKSRKLGENNTKRTNEDPMGPVTISNVPLEKRKEIMKSLGLYVESIDQSSDNNHIKTKDIISRSQNIEHGFVAERASPRIRYNLENELRQAILPPVSSETTENGNSKLENRHPQNSSVVNTERCNRPISFQTGNIQSGNPPLGKSSETNVKEKAENKTKPSTLDLSEIFLSQLDTIKNFSNGTARYPSSSTTVEKHKSRRETNVNRGNQSTVDNQNTSQPRTSQDHSERSSSPKQRRQRNEPALFQFPHNHKRLTERDFAGRNHFSVQRPARDANERVPTRDEILKRYQEQYKIQRAEHEVKKREKEAKKREEYLARYKHVDQGHRLSEGLLDEAAGYAPGSNEIETVEDVRQRQQEQLRLDALAYRERQREEQEIHRQMEEKKAREKVEKNKHVDAGYKLGHGDGKGNPRWASNTQLKNKQSEECSKENERPNHKDFRESISPELKLEGETEEEAIQQQQEQLILEMIIQDQIKLQECDKPITEEKENVNTEENNFKIKPQCKTNSQSMNPFLCSRPSSGSPNQGTPRNDAPRPLNQSGGAIPKVPASKVSKSFQNNNEMPTLPALKISEDFQNNNKVLKLPASKMTKDFLNNNEQTGRQSQNREGKMKIEGPNPTMQHEHGGTKRQSGSPRLEQLDLKVSRNSMAQVPAFQLPPGPESPSEPLPKKNASVVLKNKNGAVLVLRPTPEELNRALGRKLEVQDEVDKHGYSAHYNPTPEQEPLFSNNRFERKPGFDTDRPATGAVPKHSAVKPASSVVANVASNTTTAATDSEPPKQEEPSYDYKAEMRAARLKFQQRYEEALKKQQEEKNET